MKGVTLGLFVVLCASLYVTDAALARTLPSTHKDHPGKCWDAHREIAYKPGKTYYQKNVCHAIHCAEDFSIIYSGCGAIQPIDGFHIETDTDAAHPECCPKLVRDKKKTNRRP